MARRVNWEEEIGLRLRLRDLHVLFTVAERGSMAKAATELGISQPAVSEVIATLESALGVRLFDRHAQGVELTMYGQTLVHRSVAAFDELRQGVRDIEFLSQAASGDLRVGCGPATCAVLQGLLIRDFQHAYPNVVVHLTELPPPRRELTELRERKHDVIFGHWVASLPQDAPGDDLEVTHLFDDPLVLACGPGSKLAKRRSVKLADLINERWISAPSPGRAFRSVAQAFESEGLNMPAQSLVTSSVLIRSQLLQANEPYVTACVQSFAKHYSLKILPVRWDVPLWAVVAVTLKNRTVSPLVSRLIDCAREASRRIGKSARL